MKLKEYISDKIESQGFYFTEREVIWNNNLKPKLGSICSSLQDKYVQLFHARNMKRGKASDNLIFQIDWCNFLTEYSKSLCTEESTERERFHTNIILHSIGWHACVFLRKKPSQQQSVAQSKSRPRKHHAAMIGVLAGGVVGKMFRLLKKDTEKNAHKLKILRSLVVNNKEETPLPVQQRARDRGGLYALKPNFLPALKHLDATVHQQLRQNADRQIVKVSMKQVPLHYSDLWTCVHGCLKF